METTQEAPWHVPSDCLIKSSLEINEKCSWSLLGSFPHISLARGLDIRCLYTSLLKSTEMECEASRAVSFIFPY